MLKFQVLNRFSGAVQFVAEIDAPDNTATSVKLGLAVRWAVKTRADLSAANLYGADLYGANLSAADLYGANLSAANLYGANLSGANLSAAKLADANLSAAKLADANLYGANLYGANLSAADLSGANLFDANLSGADLSGANLYDFKLATTGNPYVHLGTPDTWEACAFVTIDGAVRVRVGCKEGFTLAEGFKYWKGKAHRREVFAALTYAKSVAKIRGW